MTIPSASIIFAIQVFTLSVVIAHCRLRAVMQRMQAVQPWTACPPTCTNSVSIPERATGASTLRSSSAVFPS